MKKLFFSVMVLAIVLALGSTYAFTPSKSDSNGKICGITPDYRLAEEIQKNRQNLKMLPQISAGEILRIINLSREANLQNGVIDPNRIYAGQKLTFKFQDGTEKTIKVEKQDCQWNILRFKLSEMEAVHGSVINYPSPSQFQFQPKPAPRQKALIDSDLLKPEPIVLAWYEKIPILLLLFLFLIPFIIAYLIYRWYNNWNANPVTSGPAQVQGGVNDSRAHERMRQIVESRFPGSRMNIKNIRRGRLSGLAKISYAQGKSKRRILKNIPAYAGEIMVNNQEETIYFLQGCGNDARNGNYITGKNLIFTSDALINSDGSESPIPPIQPPVTENQPTPPTVVDSGSEYHKHVIQAKEMFSEVLKSGEAYEVNIEVGKEGFKFSLKNKYDAKKALAKEKSSTTAQSE
jgi:hypothetical protein